MIAKWVCRCHGWEWYGISTGAWARDSAGNRVETAPDARTALLAHPVQDRRPPGLLSRLRETIERRLDRRLDELLGDDWRWR